MALTAYLNETRRLLHDSNGNFWSTSELTDYINDARFQTAVDTHCLRSLEDVAIVQDQETYDIATFTSKATRMVDILNLTLIWGQQRVPMLWAPWTQFNARFRIWVTNTNRPCVWSLQGSCPMATLYVQPVPNTDYDAEADIAYIPIPLVDNSTVDELVYPFTKPVAYYAAYKAKHKEQSYGEAQVFLQEYARKALEAINAYTRRLPNAYT